MQPIRLRLLLAMILASYLLAPLALAQDVPREGPAVEAQPAPIEPPPTPGAPVLEDPLAQPGVLTPRSCPTGRNGTAFVGEGYLFKITGRCSDTSTIAALTVSVANLTIPDGEVRLEFKAAGGAERASFRVFFRHQGNEVDDSYIATLQPDRGLARLTRRLGGQAATLAERSDLAGLVVPIDWNVLSLRMRGPSLWLVLNDEPVLAVADSAFDGGLLKLDLLRLGGLDDAEESTVVIRNLRVAALDAGDPARVPVYQPAARPSVSQIYFVVPVADQPRNPQVDAGEVRCSLTTLLCLLQGVVEYRDVAPGNRITARWLWNGAPSGRASGVVNWSPPTPDGIFTTPFNANYGVAGTLTLVVDINGHEAGRRDLAVK
jgi:hypothetical protein